VRLIRLGNHADSRDPIGIPISTLCETHTWLYGSTGSGKSRLLRLLIEGTIEQGFPTIVVDCKGDLVADVAAFCAKYQLGPDRVVILDPSDSTNVAGFNPLELDDVEPFARATIMTAGLMKAFGEGDEMKPWLMDYARHALAPLASAGLTLLDMDPFLRDQGFRAVLLERCSDPRVRAFWAHVDQMPAAMREERIGAALTRVSLLFSAGEGVRRIFGSPVSFDFNKLIDAAGVLLVNASESAGIDQSAATLLGVTVVQKILEVASRRAPGHRVPIFLFIDEFQEVASPDVVRSLAKARGWALHLTAAHQDLGQVKKVPGLYESLCSNARNFFWFRGSALDYQELVEEAFTGFWPARNVVQEIEHVSPWPVQHWQNITSRSKSRSVAEHPEVETIQEHPEVTTTSTSVSSSEGQGASSQRSRSDGPTDSTYSYGSGSSSDRGESHQENTSVTPAYASTTFTPPYEIVTESEGETTTPTLVTEYESFTQLASRQLETLEEVKDRVRSWLVNQPQRHCFVKLGQTSQPFPLVVRFTPDGHVSAQTLALYRRLLLRNFPPGDQVDRLLVERPAALVASLGTPEHGIFEAKPAPKKAARAGTPRAATSLGRRY